MLSLHWVSACSGKIKGHGELWKAITGANSNGFGRCDMSMTESVMQSSKEKKCSGLVLWPTYHQVGSFILATCSRLSLACYTCLTALWSHSLSLKWKFKKEPWQACRRHHGDSNQNFNKLGAFTGEQWGNVVLSFTCTGLCWHRVYLTSPWFISTSSNYSERISLKNVPVF